VKIRDTRPATVSSVERYEIHGQPNWRLLLVADGTPGDSPLEARLAIEAVYADPRPGDRVVLDLLMGQPVAVRLADPA